jgi:hypothetical protein
MTALDRLNELPICPICDEEIEEGTGTEEDGVIFHREHCPDDGGHDAE